MVTIIAGSRTVVSYARVSAAIEASSWAEQITEVVSGHARGVDLLGERWADGRSIPIKRFDVTETDWKHMGRGAGCVRNREMAQYAAQFPGAALILVWDGHSTGSANMLAEAKLARLRIYDEQDPGNNLGPARRPFSLDEI